jgi:general secretion pathway protein A
VLSSRRSPLDLCRTLLDSENFLIGPILLTGEAGTGKTWLCRQLEAAAPAQVRWITVDLTPVNSPADLYRLISHEIGLGDLCDQNAGRVGLIDFLVERQADGQRLILMIDDAQNLAMPVWEEVRILANRLDRPGGFSKMILVGQTSLARRFTTRPFSAIEARLAAKIHLGPIDADEALELVGRYHPAESWTSEEIEALHRDARGNPRKILRQLGLITRSAPELTTQKDRKRTEIAQAQVDPTPESLIHGPLTGPAKPPIRVDENMIEVGWSPEDPTDSTELDGQEARTVGSASPIPGGEEAVLDHYAALQAWREWADNQARKTPPAIVPAKSGRESVPDFDEEEDVESEEIDGLSPLRSDRPQIRVEGEQKFAPFSQLFSRMAQSHDSD